MHKADDRYEAPIPDPPKQPEELAPTPAGAPVVAVPADTKAVTAQTQQPIVVALLRGVALAAVVAAVDWLTSYQLDYSVKDCTVSAALLFFVTLQSRGVIEGVFDNFKATKV